MRCKLQATPSPRWQWWCPSECCMPSGLDFQAACGLVVRYCLSNFFALRASKHDMGPLSWLKAETLGRTPTPIFDKMLCPWVLFSRDYGIHTNMFNLLTGRADQRRGYLLPWHSLAGSTPKASGIPSSIAIMFSKMAAKFWVDFDREKVMALTYKVAARTSVHWVYPRLA